MSKFHDEFFAQKGTAHDDLLIRCLSDENLRIISTPPKMFDFPDHAYALLTNAGDYNDRDKMVAYWDLEEYIGKNDVITIRERGIKRDLVIDGPYELIDYETEVLCKNGGFIIGYADFVVTHSFKTTISASYLEHKFKRTFTSTSRTLVEVKPKLNDVGAVLRQLKTYHNILSRNDDNLSMCIVSGEKVQPHIMKLLEHEKVKVVTL